MELIYDNKFMLDIVDGLNYYNEKHSINKKYIPWIYI